MKYLPNTPVTFSFVSHAVSLWLVLHHFYCSSLLFLKTANPLTWLKWLQEILKLQILIWTDAVETEAILKLNNYNLKQENTVIVMNLHFHIGITQKSNSVYYIFCEILVTLLYTISGKLFVTFNFLFKKQIHKVLLAKCRNFLWIRPYGMWRLSTLSQQWNLFIQSTINWEWKKWKWLLLLMSSRVYR